MTPPANVTETQLTTKEFSERCGKPLATIQKWLRSGRLSGTKIGNRWYISPSEISRITTYTSEPTPAPNSADLGETKGKAVGAPPAPTYSVAEFSALTYLTEIGVQRWLQSGRLVGERSGGGTWRVKAESLELPHMRHLIRA